MVPGDRVKVMLQTQGVEKMPLKYTGAFDCARKIVRHEGLRGLYKGTIFTLCRDVPGSIAYYSVYEVLVNAIAGSKADASSSVILLCGGLSGVSCWVICLPADVLKSRYQTSEKNVRISKVFSDLIRNEGIRSFYKGALPAIGRAFPATAACFLGMETSRKYLDLLF